MRKVYQAALVHINVVGGNYANPFSAADMETAWSEVAGDVLRESYGQAVMEKADIFEISLPQFRDVYAWARATKEKVAEDYGHTLDDYDQVVIFAHAALGSTVLGRAWPGTGWAVVGTLDLRVLYHEIFHAMPPGFGHAGAYVFPAGRPGSHDEWEAVPVARKGDDSSIMASNRRVGTTADERIRAGWLQPAGELSDPSRLVLPGDLDGPAPSAHLVDLPRLGELVFSTRGRHGLGRNLGSFYHDRLLVDFRGNFYGSWKYGQDALLLPGGVTLGPSTSGEFHYRLHAPSAPVQVYRPPAVFLPDRPLQISPAHRSDHWAGMGRSFTPAARLVATGGSGDYRWTLVPPRRVPPGGGFRLSRTTGSEVYLEALFPPGSGRGNPWHVAVLVEDSTGQARRVVLDLFAGWRRNIPQSAVDGYTIP